MLENFKFVVDAEMLDDIYRKYEQAFAKRQQWEKHWNECYKYALPQKNGMFSGDVMMADGARKHDDIFDSTAESAVEQLAGSLLSQLTPPWSRWFGLGLGVEADDDNADEKNVGRMSAEKTEKYKKLDDIQKILQSHFDRSNFYVEAHQCYMDLVTIGTAVMMMEESPVGEMSAFKFMAVPMNEVALDENVDGKLDTVFRRSVMDLRDLKLRFGYGVFDEDQMSVIDANPDKKVLVIENVEPRINECGHQGYNYVAFVDDSENLFGCGKRFVVKSGVFERSPFICFRWLKVPSEVYGRSPVMKALPDIKTANKVVELILKNASIAVSGVWQADDDGVLNISNITLAPGVIIPKAVGSAGLTPLRTGADFDVSQLVLSDLRRKINHSLLVDQLDVFSNSKMTATEVIERTNMMSRILGATYGRLQTEFLTPVILRAVSILKRRGEIDDIIVNGRSVDLKYQSPLAKNQAVRDAENVIGWIKTVSELGSDAMALIDKRAVAMWLAKTFCVPERLMLDVEDISGCGADDCVDDDCVETGNVPANASD